MKKRIVSCLVLALLGVSVLPAMNLWSGRDHKGIERWSQANLFNMDVLARPLNWVLSRFAVSTDASQVVIGSDGWVLLGDHYENVRTVGRRGAEPGDREKGQRLGDATAAWGHWLAGKGVRTYQIMIAPDKESIYPEPLPKWARTSGPSALDALMEGVGSSRDDMLDLRPALAAAKQSSRLPIYYRTDTHWNLLGGAAAYTAMARHMERVEPDVLWLDSTDLAAMSTPAREGGDLTRFLRIQPWVAEIEPTLAIQHERLPTELHDFDSGRLIQRAFNPQIDSVNRPLLVHTPGALNQRRVLWLRDSFGTAMSPLMAATFSDVLQLHWIEALKPGGRMVDLVERWKPDIVIVTVVERLSRSDVLGIFPPIGSHTGVDAFRPVRMLDPAIASNSLEVVMGKSNIYRVTGPDAFLDFPLQSPIDSRKAPLLKVHVECAGEAEEVGAQLFWLIQGEPYFHEMHSVKFPVAVGATLVDLREVSEWARGVTVTRLRLDLDPTDQCQVLSIVTPSLGVMSANPTGSSALAHRKNAQQMQ